MEAKARLRPLLEAQDLCVFPPGSGEPAVRGVSLEVREGEWVALTGPNGCGKTSLALAVAGLWPRSQGSLRLGGTPLEPTALARAAAGVAAVLQEPAAQLFEPTVADELAFTPRNLGLEEAEAAARARSLAAELCLTSDLDADPRTLSAGRQQLVLLAAALAVRPRFLVVDEGAAHLDAGARALLVRVLRRELSRGLGLLWVTQDLEELKAADRVVELTARVSSGAALDQPVGPPGGGPAAGAFRPPWAGASERSAAARLTIGREGPASGPRIRVGGAVELDLLPGKPVALLGPNGCGKSVALEAMAGVTASPQVRLEWAVPPSALPAIASQYPDSQTLADTVEEEVIYGPSRRSGHRPAPSDVAQLLAELGFGAEVLRRSPWALSAGERRLIQAAATLMTPAPLLLFDEPTCGLDPRRTARLARLIRSAAGAVPVALATQDLELVNSLAALEVRLGG